MPSRSAKSRSSFEVGLISDTHGLLRPQALAALRGSRHIVHAGDIGDPAILEALARIAPVTAVRGNNDTDAWARRLKEREVVVLGRTRICVIHDVKDLQPEPQGVHVVVAGHSHHPRNEWRDGVLYVNPGSAGPRRFSLPVSVGRLTVRPGGLAFELIGL
jgi:putative phosphoesterase